MTKKRRAPIKSRKVELDGDYEGWWVVIRTNPPWGVVEDIFEAGDQDLKATREAFSQVFLNWNFVDEEGEAIPAPAEDPESLRRVSSDLIGVIMDRLQEELTQVPNQ